MLDTVVPFPTLVGPADLLRRMDRWVGSIGTPGWAWEVWSDLTRLATHLRARLSESGWETARALLRAHPIASVALEDPLTRWSWEKPRGHAGDAGLLDFLYRHPSRADALAAATPVGQDVHAVTSESAAAVAVRERCRVMARFVEAAAVRVASPDVLALGAGHLREIELVQAPERVRRWVALDTDRMAIETLSEAVAHYPNLVPERTAIGRLLARPGLFGSFDLVYAADLCESLDDATAAKLIRAAFTALKPGGVLLFANFGSDQPDAGYLDAFMDWQPGLRDMAEMCALLEAAPDAACASKRVFAGVSGRVVYAAAQRAGEG